MVDLIAAGQSFEGLSMDTVAARAGVRKATIYRRGPNKAELLFDALGGRPAAGAQASRSPGA